MKKQTVLVGLVVLALVFIGCSNATNPTDEIVAGTSNVQINLPTQAQRAATADGLIALTTGYHLVVTKGSSEVHNESYPSNQGTINLVLTTGSHTFTLSALSGEDVLGRGTKTETLQEGQNYITIQLTPLVNAEIGIEWVINDEPQSPEAQSAYYGSWKNINDVTRTFSSGQMTAISPSWSYTLTINSWTAVTNTDAATKTAYPNGYTISGTITSMNRGDLSSDVSQGGVPDVGSSFSHTHFLNTNKGSILSNRYSDNQSGVFTKQ